jgi:phosphatidylglycerol lysyltransferase
MLSFANLLAVRPGTEITFDLMRYRPASVDGLMEYMVVRICQWGSDQGYVTLNLGMSPLFEVGEHKRANVTERLSRLIYEHGERVYNYRGLQTFKNKFKPVWEPRFMAYQRPWDWPAAILATTGLIRVGSRESRERIAAARMGAGGSGPTEPTRADAGRTARGAGADPESTTGSHGRVSASP